MEKSTLLYDAKCSMCRNLAVKIQYHARSPVEIIALSDPEAGRLLEKFYPRGWKHDFYVLQNGSCRRGVRALPTIMKSLGARQFAALIGEYAGYRAAKSRCGHNHEHSGGNGAHATTAPGHSRREMLAYAAVAPALALSRLPRLDDPFARALPDTMPALGAQLAVIWNEAGGRFRTEIRPLAHRVRPTGDFDRRNDDAKILHRDQKVLEATPESAIAAQSDTAAEPRMSVSRTIVKGERVRDGVTQQGFVEYYGVAVDHGRYNISINVGSGTVDRGGELTVGTSLSGMVRHDMAVPLIDYVVFAEPADAATQLAGFREGVLALARHHSAAGRGRIAALYEAIAGGLEGAGAMYGRNVSETLHPTASKLVITSMPELLKFIDVKQELALVREDGVRTGRRPAAQMEEVAEGPCDCNCSCGCCCGCGCGCAIGTCGKPGCGCMCMCCCECGCGCSCCLFST